MFKTDVFPLQLGVYTGVDVGRVWFKDDISEKWHNSIGGGIWMTIVDTILGQVGLFKSDDGLRFTFNFGLNF